MRDFFGELPPFLQDYITRNHWSGFREVQQRAFEVLFDTDSHLLITAGTSSGKTEAAMFPVISSIYSDPPKGIGALYISPLKALIDDQFDRMDDIIRDADIKVTSWHGDISQSVKRGLMRNPSGIMQTTPESLQSLIFNYGADVRRMFSDLRFVIIDEVHAFMNSTRGLQLLCELASLERIAGCRPRRIGLSATLSEIGLASQWLRADSGRDVAVVECGVSADYSISVCFDRFPPKPRESDDRLDGVRKQAERSRAVGEYYSRLLRETHPYNCIIFSNSRLGAEKITVALRKMTASADLRKDIDIHHGSISKEIRKHSEERIKESGRNVTLVSTSTLELGIDIGDLDRVVQKDPPHTSSAFVQRMGRSGRRTGRPVMKMFCTDDMDRDGDHPMGIPINLVKGVALVELFSEERWVEPIMHSGKPLGLLYQQTMGYMRNKAGVDMGDLVRDVLGMYPFRNISKSEYRHLIGHLMEIGHLGEFDGSIVMQPEGERVVGSVDFLAMFSDDNMYEVVCGPELIGYIPKLPEDSDKIVLAGYGWRITEVERMTVHVIRIQQEANNTWAGGVSHVHPHVVDTMRRILESDGTYGYLTEKAMAELQSARKRYREHNLGALFDARGDGSVRIHPWTGSKRFDTLVRVLSHMEGVDVTAVESIYEIRIRTDISVDRLADTILKEVGGVDPLDLITREDILDYEKFDRYIPRSMLRGKFIEEMMDLDLEGTLVADSVGGGYSDTH